MAMNVAGAFKVLIEAQPDKAMAAFDNVLKATQKTQVATVSWADTVTALNSAYQLTTSVVAGVASVAKSAANALLAVGDSAIDLLTRGGAMEEQATQFNNLAASYNADGASIVRVIRDITDNTVSWQDQTKIATKAIASGLRGGDLEAALKYAKKFSEATGEAFESVAEKFVKAVAGGKETKLKEFGIDVGDNAGMSEIIAKITAETVRFGDAGFNAGDKFQSLNNSYSLFIDLIGKALNASPTLQAALTSLAQSAIDFVDGFGTEKQAQVTAFFDVMVQGAISAGASIAEQLGITRVGFASIFVDGAALAKSALLGIVQSVEFVGVSIASIFNAMVTGLDTAVGSFNYLKIQVIDTFVSISNVMESLAQTAFGVAAEMVLAMSKAIEAVGAAWSYLPGYEENLASEQAKNIKLVSEELARMGTEQNKSAVLLRKWSEDATNADLEWERWANSSKINTDIIVQQSARAQKAIEAMRVELPQKPVIDKLDQKSVFNPANNDTWGGREIWSAPEKATGESLTTATAQLAAAQAALTAEIKKATGMTWTHLIEVKNSGTLVDTLMDQILSAAGVRAKAEGVMVPGT